MSLQVFIGHDFRERLAWNACARSIIAQTEIPPAIAPISMRTLGDLYTRPTTRRNGRLYDRISKAPMSTEFALARFWVPRVANLATKWAVFVDADFLFMADIHEILIEADEKYAVQVVKHPDYKPAESEKMDGQKQTAYPRKNWSSLILWNLIHAGNTRLWNKQLNEEKGLHLHQFCWLKDHEIGELDPRWNVLDTGKPPEVQPFAYHYTRGTPDMIGTLPYSDQWWEFAQ